MTPTERMLTDQLLASRAEVDQLKREAKELYQEALLAAVESRYLRDGRSTMHRRMQAAQSDVALMNRQARRWKHAYERMTQIVCDAWDALPVHIREEIESPMLPSGAILPQPPDLVRGVRMLAEEDQTCDVCQRECTTIAICGQCSAADHAKKASGR